MAEIINVCKEHIPAIRFIGKPYTHEDGAASGYGHRWDEWFQNGWFDKLEALGEVEGTERGYMGFIRCPHYWIGMPLPPGTEVPEGFSHFDMPAGDVGMCWIYGNADDGSIYHMHDACREALREKGMGAFKKEDTCQSFFFERYVCPRFTQADEQGNVILDYGIYLA